MKRILNKESRATIELMIANNLITKDVAEKYFPELKESEDERIKKRLIAMCQHYIECCALDPYNVDDYKEALAWLEKQKVLTTEEYLQGKEDVLWCIKQAKKHAKDENEMGTCWFAEKWLEKQSEQKPANTIEPKFKVKKGKWYVCIKDLLDNYANKAFRKGDIYLSTQDGSLIPSNSNVPYKVVCSDTYFRDWTIADAKDGDVLVNKYGAIFINAGSSNGGTLDCYCYLSVKNKFCIEKHKTGSWLYKDEIKPATKEQRDTLMKAMTDAGYTFDFEKKELRRL